MKVDVNLGWVGRRKKKDDAVKLVEVTKEEGDSEEIKEAIVEEASGAKPKKKKTKSHTEGLYKGLFLGVVVGILLCKLL